jgi:hypothetical protein
VLGYCGAKQPEQEGGEVRYLAQLFDGAGRRGKDSTGALGDSQPLNLTEWVRIANEAYAPKTKTERKAA